MMIIAENIFSYMLHKFLKKSRLCAIRNSKVHSSSKLESGTSFVNSTMGKYSFCGYNCDINMTDIGSFCSIANDVVIGGNAHPINWVSTSPVFYNNVDSVKKKFSRHERNAPIKTIIGHDVWVGRGALIKQGVVVGSGAVIGMGSVVTKDVEPYTIVAGNPAQVLRKRFDDDVINGLLESKWWSLNDDKLTALAGFIKSPKDFLNEIHINE